MQWQDLPRRLALLHEDLELPGFHQHQLGDAIPDCDAAVVGDDETPAWV